MCSLKKFEANFKLAFVNNNSVLFTWFQKVKQDKNLTERARKKSIQAVKFMLDAQSRGQNMKKVISARMYTL